MSGLEVAGFVFGLVGAVDLCLKCGRNLTAAYATYKGTAQELDDYGLRLRLSWHKSEQMLLVLQAVAHSPLQASHRELFTSIASNLGFKLQQAEADLRALFTPEGAVRRLKFIIFKKSLDKTVTKLEMWETRLHTAFLLIPRTSNPDIDQALLAYTAANPTVMTATATTVDDSGGLVPTMVGLRRALKMVAEGDGTVDGPPVVPAETFSSKDRISSAARVETACDTKRKRVLICTLEPNHHTDLVGFQQDVRKLATVLSRADPSTFGILACRAVIENLSSLPPTPSQENTSTAAANIQLVFDFPPAAALAEAPRSLRQVLRTSTTSANGHTCSLGQRIELARQLARSIMFVHSCKFVHKNVRPETIILFRSRDSGPGALGKPFLLGFERFRPLDGVTVFSGEAKWNRGLYQHPRRQGAVAEERYRMQHDIYSLGVCLLEIGLWSSFIVRHSKATVPGPELLSIAEDLGTGVTGSKHAFRIKDRLVEMAERRLPACMGERYLDVVVTCLKCLDAENDFGDKSEFVDEDDILVGVRFMERILGGLEEIVV